MTKSIKITSAAQLSTIHDFGGFDERINRLNYDINGDPLLAQRMVELLQENKVKASLDKHRGLDHGAWIPLMLAFPEKNIPVIQMSMPMQSQTQELLNMGKILKPLRDENILIVSSGGITHNLYELRPAGAHLSDTHWARDFSEWVHDMVSTGEIESLQDFLKNHPSARKSHPTDEHFLPLFVALGLSGGLGQRIHSSIEYATLSMDAYLFD